MIAVLIVAAAATASHSGLAQRALEPWATFIGHCWSGAAPISGGIDTHCFEAVYGGQHVRDRHEVKIDGKAVYRGETLYSVEGGQVSFTYWNSLGDVGRGRAKAEGAELRFTGSIRGEPLDATWHKVDGGYEVTDAGRTRRLFTRAD
jgi:hypothetical protein